ncbi:glutamate synthase [candidate division LCP-89 bacterium B3_LCP]|uniref:Glutamate synthase n=1 Tax=candidate division LCP-89 bacterium B3_LCP TaxID=2012998 RepID=A0A532UYQ6_UNCL8|nr:MAG: glutamate synthase [candidate division LCP-89 bacterium B3_LCP]
MNDEKVNIKSYRDIPIAAASLGKMSVNKTASWRNAEPYYEEKSAPCNLGCPAGTDVVKYLHLATQGKYEEGWKTILNTNPFPATCGRVCPHPCEVNCNRENLGGRLNIHMIERFLGDVNFDKKLEPEFLEDKKDKSIGVVGAGPAGLSCAYQMARRGYGVTVYEALSEPGGMMRVGIPDYRLPKEILTREIDFILDHGVKLKLNTRIGKEITFEDIRAEHDAVYVATGLHLSRNLGAEGQELEDVIPGIEVLRKIAFKDEISLGDEILVVGGGNTALDAARSVLRMGCKPRIVYRRSREEMPAIAEEIEDLIEEGIPIDFLTLPKRVYGNDNGKIVKVECVRMELGEPDDSGRRRPVEIEGSNFNVEADMVITAIGEQPDLSYLTSDVKAESWGVLVDGYGRTNLPDVFAGGDSATGDGTVTHAVGHGRQTALAIDAFLKGEDPPDCEVIEHSVEGRSMHQVEWEEINPVYFEPAERLKPKGLEIPHRVKNFEEVYSGFTEEEVLHETSRCMSCGNCPECDNCLVFCPDSAVTKNPDGGYTINYEFCKGCGICVAECPRSAISIKVL